MPRNTYPPPPARHRESQASPRRVSPGPYPDDDPDDRTLPVPNISSGHSRRRVSEKSGSSWVQPAGESGRRGFHPIRFMRISWKSTSRASLLCNLLWPVVPAAIAVRCTLASRLQTLMPVMLILLNLDALPDRHTLIFILAYIAMVPCANLVGFAGQELARKFPRVYGVLTEITYVALSKRASSFHR